MPPKRKSKPRNTTKNDTDDTPIIITSNSPTSIPDSLNEEEEIIRSAEPTPELSEKAKGKRPAEPSPEPVNNNKASKNYSPHCFTNPSLYLFLFLFQLSLQRLSLEKTKRMPTAKYFVPEASSSRATRSTSKATSPMVLISEPGPSNPSSSSSQTPKLSSSKIPKEQSPLKHQEAAASSDLSSVRSVSAEAEQSLETRLEALKYIIFDD
jgi:hypothetical protein